MEMKKMKMKMKKMKMKNLKLLAAGLAMTASLTACGSSARETVQSADSSTETQTNSAMQTENSQAQEAAPGETAEMTLILRGGSYAEVIKKALPDFEADHNCKIEVLEMSFDDLHTGIALDAVNETGTYDLCMVDGSWIDKCYRRQHSDQQHPPGYRQPQTKPEAFTRQYVGCGKPQRQRQHKRSARIDQAVLKGSTK